MIDQQSLSKMISIIRNGLNKTSEPKKIVIIGAGITGLVSASLLKQAGHDVTILEANSRLGGRVFTIRDPFSAGLFFDAGAMRIPHNHYLIWEYIRKFNIQTNPFINSTPNDILYANGIKTRRWIYEQNPDIFRYHVAQNERGRTAGELFRSAVDPLLKLIKRYDHTAIWKVNHDLEMYSLDNYLRRQPYGNRLSSQAIEKVKVLFGVQGFSEYYALHVLQAFWPIVVPDVDFYEITEGFDVLPNSFLPELQNNIYMNERVKRIIYRDNDVAIQSENMATGEFSEIAADYAIVTTPFSVLNLIDIEPYWGFSQNKRRAIRELRYMPLTKVGIEFKSRFWEKQGLHGGHFLTDMISRISYYPSQGIGTDTAAVILASYTLGADTLPWDSQPENDQISNVLFNLAKIHGNIVYNEFVNGVAQNWRNERFIAGDIAVFLPEQASQIGPYIATPEGRVHFAGEHTSSHPAWIEGAIESAVRVAMEVHEEKRTR